MRDVFRINDLDPELIEAERQRALASIVEAVPHTYVHEIGSTAVDGLIGKQDLAVDEVRALVETAVAAKHPHLGAEPAVPGQIDSRAKRRKRESTHGKVAKPRKPGDSR